MFNALIFLVFLCREQPPSGGCVLKQRIVMEMAQKAEAAAFGRLCVETLSTVATGKYTGAAAFGRLCVETLMALLESEKADAAAFGRLCVETSATARPV